MIKIEKQLMGTNGHINLCEDYVSFEVAKLLKEKGFDEKCHSAWIYNPKKDNSEYFVEYLAKTTENNTELEYFNEPDTDWAYSAPTHQMALKWLREIHNIDIQVFRHIRGNKITFYGRIEQNTHLEHLDKCNLYKSYEDAVEVSIKYCLTNLIK